MLHKINNYFSISPSPSGKTSVKDARAAFGDSNVVERKSFGGGIVFDFLTEFVPMVEATFG